MSSSPPRPPPFVICYLCGRKYGTKSVAIHEPHCIKKWHAENKKLPKHLRRKMPTKPDYSKLNSGDFDGDYIEEMNQASYKAAQEQLIPCGNCGRTFLPDRLQVHQKSCTVDNPMKKAGTGAMPRTKTSLGNNNNYNNHNSNSSGGNDQQPSSDPGGPPPKTVHKNKLCCFCMKKVPVSILANHLVKCNDSKILELKGSSDSVNGNNDGSLEMPVSSTSVSRRNTFNKGKKPSPTGEGQQHQQQTNTTPNSEKIERPSTRTLKKRPTTATKSGGSKNSQNPHGTYDIDSPDDDEIVDGSFSQPPVTAPSYKTKTAQKTPSHSFENGTGQFNSGDPPAFSGDSVSLEACGLCNRRFAADRLDRHMVICQKTNSKTRKVFDSSKQRMIEGADPKAVAASMKSNPPKTKKQTGAWRQQHEDFIRSIRAAKQVTKHMAAGGKASDLPPPPPSLNPDYVHCQYCDRRFNPEVAQRHIPKCATTMNRPKPPKQKALELYNNNSKNGGRSSTKQPKGNFNSPKSSNNVSSSRQNNARPVSQKQSNRGYSSPTVDRGYQNYNTNNNNNNNNRQSFDKNSPRQKNDPYKPKTFSGINNRTQSGNRGYSYNVMNSTGPNFFG